MSCICPVNQGKLAPRDLKGFFIGYPEGFKGYKILCIDLNLLRYLIHRDVVFNKSQLLRKRLDKELAESD